MLLVRLLSVYILVGFALAVSAQGQSRDTDHAVSLEQQVQRLAHEVERLEGLVRQLQLSLAAPAGAQEPPGAAFARIERGMTRREVVQLIGEPSQIQRAADFYREQWNYSPSVPGGRSFWVQFAENGRVFSTAYD